ncbi:Wide host range VirA protein [Planctomycetes bacterium MalM25]|nr:Wide host range VirA protein [Planctomycetes bacterium MalM25]
MNSNPNADDVNQAANESLGYATNQRMEAINRLAAGVSHEFNNVLQIVCGYVTFARDSLPEGSATRDDLTNALNAADRAATLASRLLQLARADEDHDGPADANDAVESLRLLLGPILGEEVRVEVDCADDLPMVAAADGLLRQALLNLCVNARDAMSEGGVIRLRTRLLEFAEPLELDLGKVEAGQYVAVSVEDDGEGIDPETQQRLFEPFFTTKAVGKGTGLGLSMVASFVSGSSGAIRFTSAVDEGARFELILPVMSLLAEDDDDFDPDELLAVAAPF